MHFARISTISFFFFQFSTCSYIRAETLPSSRTSDTIAPLTSSAKHHSSQPSSHAREIIKPLNPKQHSRKYKRRSSCASGKPKNYRARTKVDDVVSKVDDAVYSSVPKSGDANSGDATYYGTGLGACGIESKDGDMIAAASHLLFDTFPGATANPNQNPICGRKVKATYEERSVEVQIVDRCTGCAMHDLDFSPTAFAQLGKMETGRLHGMKWEWM